MTFEEYENWENATYEEYVEYLKRKYGSAKYDYFTKNWTKIRKVTRTNEGLFVHHVFEDHAIMLGNPEYAKNNPFEWQKAENLVYCDWLEHLLLHIKIYQFPAKDKNENEDVGIGGAINFIIPELNDLYSGFQITQPWKKNCFDKVSDEVSKNVYILMVDELLYAVYRRDGWLYDEVLKRVLSSAGEKFGLWQAAKNKELTDRFEQPTYWAHNGGSECLIGGVYDEDLCSLCRNPVCVK